MERNASESSKSSQDIDSGIWFFWNRRKELVDGWNVGVSVGKGGTALSLK